MSRNTSQTIISSFWWFGPLKQTFSFHLSSSQKGYIQLIPLLPVWIATIQEQRNILPWKLIYPLKNDGWKTIFLIKASGYVCSFSRGYIYIWYWIFQIVFDKPFESQMATLQEILTYDKLKYAWVRSHVSLWAELVNDIPMCWLNSGARGVCSTWTIELFQWQEFLDISCTDKSFLIWLVIPHQFPQLGCLLAQIPIYIYTFRICNMCVNFHTRKYVYTQVSIEVDNLVSTTGWHQIRVPVLDSYFSTDRSTLKAQHMFYHIRTKLLCFHTSEFVAVFLRIYMHMCLL